jgi:hypothetical protein
MTIDPSAHHPDPFGEGFSHSSQKAAQFISMVGAAYEIAARRKAIRAARDAARTEQQRRALQEQERAARADVRARWAPAHDARWLAQADLLQVGGVWGAAAPYADTDPEAASALRKAEGRLRVLHPYAMARYDRLRVEGADPLEAMRETVYLFAREPHARPGQPATTRPGIEAGTPSTGSWPDAAEAARASAPQPGPRPDLYQDAEQRGRRIVERLQARALAERGSRLSPDELATALEASTTLPAEVIARLARARSEESIATRAERARATDRDRAAAAASATQSTNGLTAARRDTMIADTAGAQASPDRTAAQLAAESFPCTTADGVRAAVNGRLQQAAPSPARTAATHNAPRPGLAP